MKGIVLDWKGLRVECEIDRTKNYAKQLATKLKVEEFSWQLMLNDEEGFNG